MTTLRNVVRIGAYLDSVALMRMSRAIAALDGVVEAGLMIGTPANKAILGDAGILDATGAEAEAGDLIIAVKAKTADAAAAAIKEAERLLDQPRQRSSDGAAWKPRSLRAAVTELPDANLAIISVPGDFAASEALKAVRRGLNVMIFSDNVPLAEEAELKREARDRGLLVMGPDCGTAIVAGTPLAFANVVPRGDIGIVGASGTGIQEVTCLIARAGRGISHAIGTGGRDLKAEIGGITTLMAIDALDADPATKHIVLISKPPAAAVASAVLARAGRSRKPFTVCFLGGDPSALALPPNATFAPTLARAAALAAGRSATDPEPHAVRQTLRGPLIHGLFAGGTLCAEAQIVLMQAGFSVTSNAPVPGAAVTDHSTTRHRLIDLGDDEFTRGKPHPMIEPAVRDAPLAAALADPKVGIVLLDCVLGYGGHIDPAGHLAGAIAAHPGERPVIIASVTGTAGDPQGLAGQIASLERAGVLVAASNQAAAQLAARLAAPSN
jgi:FdrA protein